MLRRVLVGIPLASLIILVVGADGYISTLAPPELHIPPMRTNLFSWFYHGALCTLVVLILTALTTRELVHFARNLGYKPFAPLAQILGAGLVLGPYVAFNTHADLGLHQEGWGMLWLACGTASAFLLQASFRKTEHTMENIATTLFIVFYGGGLAGFMTKLRMEVGGAEGVAMLLFGIFVVKMTDTGAYFVGKGLGRHKLIPWLSPRKTWEGFVGGVVVATLSSWGVGAWLMSLDLIHLPPGPLAYPWGLLIFGAVMGLFGTAGDLCASLLKRDAAVKDSGDSIPGLGGVLDIFDSPLLAAPAMWFFWTRLLALTAS